MVLSGTERLMSGHAISMPAFGNAYSDAEIAAVANFVTDRFGGVSSNVTAADVGKLRQAE